MEMKISYLLTGLLSVIMAVLFLPSTGVAAERYAPEPECHTEYRDDVTYVWFDVPDGVRITYTDDGSRPTKESARYKGEKIRLTEPAKLRLRSSEKGSRTKIYSYRIDVREKELIRGKPLRKGDTIGIVAPAKYLDEDISQAVKDIHDRGFKVKVGKSCYLRAEGGFAGTAAQRAADLNAFFLDDEVDAIVCLRGGSGCMDILGLLDFDMIARHPKLLLGYSDITVLHAALFRECGLVTIHGPMINNILDLHTPYTLSCFYDGLTGKIGVGSVRLPEGAELTALYEGEAKGRIVGGNLSRICDLIGTGYEIDGDGCILLIEDIHETAGSLDNMMKRLYDNGLLDRVDGIVFGEFTDCPDEGGRSWKDVAAKYAELCGKPCLMGLPAGHDADNMFLPLGVKAMMRAGADGSGELFILQTPYDTDGDLSRQKDK